AVGAADMDRVLLSHDRIGEICQIYKENLLKLGRFVRSFIIHDESNVRDNALFFCGNHKRGLEKIKEAMWNLDPIHGNSFSAYHEISRQPQGPMLFPDQPQTSELGRSIMSQFKGQSGVNVNTIFDWVIKETETFLPKHVRIELEKALERGKISYSDPTPNSRTRRIGNWPKCLMIDFRE
ncbi:hypothetical protein IH879_14030, partial [candidate division KSB1 bacterium]|nr:hypothetical protein [candidate division KSB1 bacterium]